MNPIQLSARHRSALQMSNFRTAVAAVAAFGLGVGPVVAAASGSTITLSLTGTTPGRQIVVGVSWIGNTNTISSISCTGESNLTVHGSPLYSVNIGFSQQIASLANNTTGGDKTIVVTLSGASNALDKAFAIEFSGGDTASFFDADHDGAGANGALSTTHTTGSDSALIVAMAQASTAPAVGRGFTLINFSANFHNAEYQLNAGAAGAKTVAFVENSNSLWKIKSASFNLA